MPAIVKKAGGGASCFFPCPANERHEDIAPNPALPPISAPCPACGRDHQLPADPARPWALSLMARLEAAGRIDFLLPGASPDPAYRTDYLFGPARGQMFGVLLCRDPDGTTGLVHAFSGQYDGRWLVPGWAPPLFSVEEMTALTRAPEAEIKALGREMEQLTRGSAAWRARRRERRRRSRELMAAIHGRYRLHNFRGQSSALPAVFAQGGKQAPPTGTGDCCAPKLLDYAARHDLVPLGLAEFFFGRENRSATRRHGVFYPPCAEKCAPILGFMLCGLEGCLE